MDYIKYINDFFRWWITDSNGNEYMTLIGCSYDDVPVWSSLVVSCLLVMIIYVKIGWLSLKKSREYGRSITKSYLVEKTNVFVFCAIAGYLMVAISVFVNPYKLRVLINIILFIWSYRFYQSMKRSNVIERIYENEKELTEIRYKYNQNVLSWQNIELQKIGIDVLFELPLFEKQYLNGITFWKIEQGEDYALYLTECERNSDFGLHCHPGLIEKVTVLEGHLIDPKNDVYVEKGGTITYRPSQPHMPGVKIFSRYEVLFTKVKER